MLDYRETITSSGIVIPFIPSIITPPIERQMRLDRYEGGESATLGAILRPGDRVLELGGGLGLVSTIAARTPGIGRIITVEANPELVPVIRETHRLNGVHGVELRNGIATAEDGRDATFYLHRDFWASSMTPKRHRHLRRVRVPRLSLHRLILELDPTVIVCDIEGGEQGLFADADLSRVRAMVMELHPKVYGREGMAEVLAPLAEQGFTITTPGPRKRSTIRLLTREGGAQSVTGEAAARAEPAPGPASEGTTPARGGRDPGSGRESFLLAAIHDAPAAGSSAPAHPFPPRRFNPWPISTPHTLIATCMKNEGPFILEWVAWHRALGVTDIVVFSNHCSDGTDAILDRLDEMGLVQHLPNPALVAGKTAFQPIALDYVQRMGVMRRADFFISLDVDEFINIRTGDHTLRALFAATGAFDVLSMSEVNHGVNGHDAFRPGWLNEMMPMHQGNGSACSLPRRGVKSIVRLSERVKKLRNHRPYMHDGPAAIRWLDGSGRPTRHFSDNPEENGHDARGSFDLVRMEHFPLRSLGSYLVKMARGDVVMRDRMVGQRYWHIRNRHEARSAHTGYQLARAKDWHARHLECDAVLMALHESACAAHSALIARLLEEPLYAERRRWILENSWEGRDDDPLTAPDTAATGNTEADEAAAAGAEGAPLTGNGSGAATSALL